MIDVEESKLALLEYRFSLDMLEATLGNQLLVDALLALHGWSGESPKTVSEVSRTFGLEPAVVRKANSQFEGFVEASFDGRLEEAVEDLPQLLPFPIPTLGQWLVANGYTRLDTFSIESFLDAAEMYMGEDELPFRPMSTRHTKWLVDIDDPGMDIDFVDAVVEKALLIAPQWGVIDVDKFDSLKRFFIGGAAEVAWAAIDACPQLATMDETTLVFSRSPKEDAKIVLRLDRLLAFLGAVPLAIALRQITRDGSHGVLPVCDLETFEAFIQRCDYYDIEDGDVVSKRPLVVDEELSAREKPVVLALVEHPAGATINELVTTTPKSVDDKRVREVVSSSPLIVELTHDRYSLLDPSMYDAILTEGQEVSTPAPTTSATWASDQTVDLVHLGRSGTFWWSMHAGDINERQLRGAVRDNQKYMPILEPDTGKCMGMVRTSRVYNKKYRGGIPTILANDKGLKGRELPRFVSRAMLLDALSEAPFVYFNDSSKRGQDSWGIVQRQDIEW